MTKKKEQNETTNEPSKTSEHNPQAYAASRISSDLEDHRGQDNSQGTSAANDAKASPDEPPTTDENRAEVAASNDEEKDQTDSQTDDGADANDSDASNQDEPPTPEGDPLIRIQQVSRSFVDGRGTLHVLQKLDWSVYPGESIAIIGRSGSGKSTLLNLIGGLDREYQGKVEVDGNDLSQLNDQQLALFRNNTIGFIFQSFHLMDQLTCEENVLLPTWFSRGKELGLEQAKAVLEKVGLKDKIGQRPGMLSGGEKQRVAIARALIMEPKILLCDEPTGNLDEQTGEDILELFQTLQRETGLTLILVTHEARTAQIAQRVYLLQQGKLNVQNSNQRFGKE